MGTGWNSLPGSSEGGGGNDVMGEAGCVGWMFAKKGIFSFPKATFSEDQLMETIWPQTKSLLEKTLGPGLFNLWIKPLAARAGDGCLELIAPNAFVASWVRERLVGQVAEAAAVVMSYRAAFLLGEGFLIQEARSLSRGVKMEDWCSVGLSDVQESEPRGALAVPLPASLSGGDAAVCFYCGLNNHQPRQCPSKSLAAPRPEVWDRFGQVDLDRIEALSQEVEASLSANPLEGMWRRHPDLNRRMEVLQTSALPLGYAASLSKNFLTAYPARLSMPPDFRCLPVRRGGAAAVAEAS